MPDAFKITACTAGHEQIFVLPPADNADHRIYLHADRFGLHEDACILLEALDGVWRIRTGSRQRMEERGKPFSVHAIRDGDTLLLATPAGDRIALLVRARAEVLSGYAKYDLRETCIITVGRSEGNMICYDIGRMVSEKHAVLKKEKDGWRVEDLGANGIYLNGCRAGRSSVLRFGDRVSIAGLQLVFLGNMLAVDHSSGRVRVKGLSQLKQRSICAERDGAAAGKTAPRSGRSGKRLLCRAPRIMEKIESGEIKIDLPPALPQETQQPFILLFGPALTMSLPMAAGSLMMTQFRDASAKAGIYMYAGLVMALLAGLMSAGWAGAGAYFRNREMRLQREHREDAYNRYLGRIMDELREKAEKNTAALLGMYPEAAVCAAEGTAGTARLWNRNRKHGDFLQCRLGLGEIPFQVRVVVPGKSFSLHTDILDEKPLALQERFKMLRDVPVLLDLKQHPLMGIIGGEDLDSSALVARLIAVQIAAAHSYTDVRMVFLYDEAGSQDLSQWAFAGWLPHTWSDDRTVRYTASNKDQIRDISHELSEIIRRRKEAAAQTGAEETAPFPYFVVFVADSALLQGEVLRHYLLEANAQIGLSVLILAGTWEHLPNECSYVIQNDDRFRGMFQADAVEEDRVPIRFDRLSAAQAEKMARALSDIEVEENGHTGALPPALTFLEMYGVRAPEELQIRERWLKNRTEETLQAPVGVRAGGVLCCLDAHEKGHGPHGLIAGTTGSGKSELLQTWILSMAVCYSPSDIAFLIIDYKGGTMADLFEKLPHTAGCISNLSGSGIQRALVSVKSECLRRQRIFSEYHVTHVNAYSGLFRRGEASRPVPHLFILVDEFAELKKEEPDFLRELVSVAQVGRSLGVHLLLATQKPSGTVDANIWSNARFRLCLRVQDAQDSMDVLRKPDAAYLTQAGQCCFQVGNDELYEVFQAGWSGAAYAREGERPPDRMARLLTRTGRTDPACEPREALPESDRADGEDAKRQTQLEAVVQLIKDVAERNGYPSAGQLWLPPLPGRILLDSLEAFAAGTFDGSRWKEPAADRRGAVDVIVGMLDDPENQRQLPMRLSFTESGHLAVVGGIVSGKSTFLQTVLYSLIMSYSPDALHIYVVEPGGHQMSCFEKAPHAGGIVCDGQDVHLARLMHLLETLLTERKRLLGGEHFSQYRQARGERLPAVFLMIDDFAAFREKTGDRYEQQMITLSREGAGCGIFLIISAGGFSAAQLPGRIAENCTCVAALTLPDRYAYADALRTSKIDVRPEAGMKGRGLFLHEENVLEFQTALAASAGDDYSRLEKIRKTCREMALAWSGAAARGIPQIPSRPLWRGFRELAEVSEAVRTGYLLPVGYDEASAGVFSIDLRRTFCYLITGAPRTGKKNFLKIMICCAGLMGARIIVLDPGGILSGNSALPDLTLITDRKVMEQFITEQLCPLFEERNRLRTAQEMQEAEDAQPAETAPAFRPVFIFMPDLAQVLDAAAADDAGMGPVMDTLILQGRFLGIYLAGCVSSEERPEGAGKRLFRAFALWHTGIHFGGNAAANPFMNFDHLSYREQTALLRPGIGLLPSDAKKQEVKSVLIPLAPDRASDTHLRALPAALCGLPQDNRQE